MTSDDLLAWLRPFCGDASLPVRPRIDVLQILESNFSLGDSDVRLLLLYRTQAVLKDREVTAHVFEAMIPHVNKLYFRNKVLQNSTLVNDLRNGRKV